MSNERPNPPRNDRRRWPFQPILTNLVAPIVCRCIGEWIAKLLDRWNI